MYLLGELLANNYIAFGAILSAALLMPIFVGAHRDSPILSRGAAVAAAAMIAVIFASLALGAHSRYLYLVAIYYQFGTALVAAMPYARKEPHMYAGYIVAAAAIMGYLFLLYAYMLAPPRVWTG